MQSSPRSTPGHFSDVMNFLPYCEAAAVTGCHVGGVELLGGRLGRRVRGLGRVPVGAVLLVTLEVSKLVEKLQIMCYFHIRYPLNSFENRPATVLDNE